MLKGFPRRSETFIASEIHRVEQLGVDVRLFVLKPADEPDRQPVVDRIRAVPAYLPATTSLSGSAALPWLVRNLRPFLPAIGAVAPPASRWASPERPGWRWPKRCGPAGTARARRARST